MLVPLVLLQAFHTDVISTVNGANGLSHMEGVRKSFLLSETRGVYEDTNPDPGSPPPVGESFLPEWILARSPEGMMASQ